MSEIGSYSFPDGIPGFETSKRFDFIDLEKVFNIITDVQGLISDHVLFACVDPHILIPNYDVELNHEQKGILQNVDKADLKFLCNLHLNDIITIDLMNPLIFDTKTKFGLQYVGAGRMIPAEYTMDYVVDVSKIKGLDKLLKQKQEQAKLKPTV